MIYLFHLLTIPLAVIYSHVAEWVIHKYILHGLGKNRKSIWAFHWHAHHNKARKNDFYDEDYLDDWTGPPLREQLGLFFLIFVHFPIVFYAPLFVVTLALRAKNYYKIHKYAHLNPDWGRANLRWHHDHHMGKDQDSNWGVTVEWVDKLFGTRTKY